MLAWEGAVLAVYSSCFIVNLDSALHTQCTSKCLAKLPIHPYHPNTNIDSMALFLSIISLNFGLHEALDATSMSWQNQRYPACLHLVPTLPGFFVPVTDRRKDYNPNADM